MQSATPDASGKKNLTQLSSDCLMLILELRTSQEYGDADVLRQNIKRLLEQLERNCRHTGIDSEDVQQAKFALVSFIDESILGSGWSQKQEWARQPLTLEFYNTLNFGEEFFNRLEHLRQKINTKVHVLDVFYLCLALGFRGKYLFDREQIRGVIEELHTDLMRVKDKSTVQLSPHGKPREVISQVVRERVPVWVVAVAAMALGLLFYITMTISISNKAQDTRERIEAIAR